MAEDGGDGQEKTEEPTQKRLDDARAEGRVLSSKEMYVFTALALATLVLAVGRPALEQVPARWAAGLRFEAAEEFDALVVTALGDALRTVILAGLVLGLPFVAIAVGTQLSIGGIAFSPKAMAPKWNKLDPLKGLKRMVSMQALVELAKAILKVALLIGAGAMALYGMVPALDRTAGMATGDALAVFGAALLRVLGALTLVLAGIGAIDLVWQIHQHTTSLKMSRQDLKQEMKDSEGSPEQKGRIRSLQYQAARRAAERASVGRVSEATAIVTNPQHFAVALKYEPGQPGAPVILAMGRDVVARDIRSAGRKHAVTMLSAPPLARALYFTGRIGDEIPVDLYAAVATLLAHVWRIEHGMAEEMPEIDLPDFLRFDANGRPERRDRPRRGQKGQDR